MNRHERRAQGAHEKQFIEDRAKACAKQIHYFVRKTLNSKELATSYMKGEVAEIFSHNTKTDERSKTSYILFAVICTAERAHEIESLIDGALPTTGTTEAEIVSEAGQVFPVNLSKEGSS